VLRSSGPSRRAALASRLGLGSHATYHALRQASLAGTVCFGPDVDGEPTWVALADWLGAAVEPVDRSSALAELAGRYLAAHAPATVEDLATWSGLTMLEAREAVGRLGSAVVPVAFSGTTGLMLAARPGGPVDPGGVVRLLPAYDPYLLGYRSRALAVPAPFARRVHPGGGLLRPTVVQDGVAVGTWSLPPPRAGGSVTITPFSPDDADWLAAAEREAAAVSRFLS
jgi:hypothetical protein